MGERTSYREGTPSWIDLMTSDPEGARAFYGALFGWEFDISPDADTGNYTMAMLRGKMVAGLGGQPAPDGMPTVWTTYFAADDVDKTVACIREHGGSVQLEPMDVMESGRMAIAADPTGGAFGMWQAGQHTGAQLVNEPGTVVWNELATRDLAGATEFYAGVFGLSWEELDTGGTVQYRTLHADGNVVAGSLQMDGNWPAEVPPHWMPYFAVEDADAAGAQAAELGGKVEVPPTDSPYGRFSVLSDPQGGHFTVIATTDPAS